MSFASKTAAASEHVEQTQKDQNDREAPANPGERLDGRHNSALLVESSAPREVAPIVLDRKSDV